MARNHKRVPEGPFYRELGLNLRVARSAAGKTQSEIAAHLDVSFQQIQKYENGTNRIPIDRLLRFAAFLEVPISQFVAPSDGDSDFQSLAAQFSADELRSILEIWRAIKDRPARPALLKLLKRVADIN